MADPAFPQTMTDADVAPADPQPRSAEPVKDSAGSAPAGGADGEGEPGEAAASSAAGARQAIRDGAGKLQQQATDKVRQFADDGKERAGSALDQLSQLLTDAAQQVDDKLGAQYGDYARNAAGQVQTLAASIRDRDVDALVEDARTFVRQTPAVAIGVAAAFGFAITRLVQSGAESRG